MTSRRPGAGTRAAELVAETGFPSAKATQCPYGLYAALRADSPVFQIPSGEYVVSRHEDVFELTRQPAIFSSHHSVFEDGYMRAATLEDHADPNRAWGIVNSDPPDHDWKRRVAFEMFKPGRLRGREPLIESYADELIDAFADAGRCEFVADFAEQLPARVILTLFGLSLDYVDRAIAWGRYEGFGMRFAERHVEGAARDAILDLDAFVRGHVLERVERPGDDDLSRHIQRHVEVRGGLDLANLVAEATGLFIGGIITTTHLISSMMMLFLQNPAQQAKARSSQSLLKKAVEEALRLESPVQLGPRLVLHDTEVGGVPIPAGSIVLVVWGSANRDERVFEQPDRFDIERPNPRSHMAFGNSPHFCMGAPLARMEATAAFRRIFSRLEDLRLAPGEPEAENQWAVIFRGPRQVHLAFNKAA